MEVVGGDALHGRLVGLEGLVPGRLGDGPLGDELLGQGGVRPLQLGGEGGGGDVHGVGPEEGLPVHPLGQDAAVLRQGPGVVPGEVGAVHIVQGPEHEGHVHGPGGGLPGAEGGVRDALGETLGIGVGHVAVRPGGHVGEGVGLFHPRRLSALAQGPDQHGHRLLSAGGPVQVEVGEAVSVLPHAQEEAQALQAHGLPLLTRQVPALRRPDSPQAQRQAQQGAQHRSDLSSHLIHLHILVDFGFRRAVLCSLYRIRPCFCDKKRDFLCLSNVGPVHPLSRRSPPPEARTPGSPRRRSGPRYSCKRLSPG